MVVLFLIVWKTSILFSIVSAQIYISINYAPWFPVLHLLIRVYSFDNSHSYRCGVVAHCCLICMSPVISDVRHLFMFIVKLRTWNSTFKHKWNGFGYLSASSPGNVLFLKVTDYYRLRSILRQMVVSQVKNEIYFSALWKSSWLPVTDTAGWC